MAVNANKCPSCSAPISLELNKCKFCGTEFIRSHNGKLIIPERDFGFKGMRFFNIILLGIIVIYIIGWLYINDIGSFKDSDLTLIWALLLPIWVFFTSLIWSCKKGAVLYGVVISIIFFIIHILLIGYYFYWEYRDIDYFLSVFYALILLGAWLLGRLNHFMIRKTRNRTKIIKN